MGSEKIGTTKRGIGPAYEDKIARRGLKAFTSRIWIIFEEIGKFDTQAFWSMFMVAE